MRAAGYSDFALATSPAMTAATKGFVSATSSSVFFSM
jgi:hypothetical protein